MRETIAGVLRVIRTKKRLSRSGNLGDMILENVLRAMEADGKLAKPLPEWPPTYWVETDRLDYTGHGPFMYRFKNHRYASLTREMEGWHITVRATIDPWSNGVGAYLVRPQILDVRPPADGTPQTPDILAPLP